MLSRPLSSRTSFLGYGAVVSTLLGRMEVWQILAFFAVVSAIETWMCRDKGQGNG